MPPDTTARSSDGGENEVPSAPDRRQPTRLRRHPAATFAVAAIVWVVAALSWQLTSRSGGPQAAPGWVRSLPGQVVSLNEEGALVVSAPDGSHPVVRPNLGFHDSALGLLVPADARFVLDPTGGVGATGGAQTVRNRLVAQLGPSAQLAMPDAFSDAEQAVVVLWTPGANRSTSLPASNVSLEILSSARVVSLGVADTAAGDPRSLGAFVTVPAFPMDLYGVGGTGAPDLAVQLRDVGSRVVTLATADELERDLHQDPSKAVSLAVYPDPTGDKVAVVVSPMFNAAINYRSDGGVVVLDRSGRVLGVGPALDPAGGGGGSHPAWSPDGKSLAYIQSASNGADLIVWTVGERATTRAVGGLPAAASCMWGPNDRAILCPVANPQGESEQWAVGRAGQGTFVRVTAPGVPEAWVAGVKM